MSEIVGTVTVKLMTPAGTIRFVPVLSCVFAVVSMVGGIMLALGGAIPISPFVTTLSFLIYVACRIIGGVRDRRRLPRTPRLATEGV